MIGEIPLFPGTEMAAPRRPSGIIARMASCASGRIELVIPSGGGYRYTVVAGAVVQAGGELTGARPGTMLRPGG